nr:gamma-aminobutyric acid receptor alpha-like isoform X2 [Danaus plexippus plexippus]
MNTRENLRSHYVNQYGLEIANRIRRLEYLKTKKAKLLPSLNFLKRCRDHDIIPTCVKISPKKDIKHSGRILHQASDFSVLQVSFNLKRHTGYFLIQVYVPCILIVVLSWVSFWIHREATSDRVGLGITTVLTLSTISLDSRTDLPKVRYATALDWFLLMSFFYCIATLLEFAGVHYFTKVGSGEIVIDDSEWEDLIEEVGGDAFAARQLAVRRRSSARSSNNFSMPGVSDNEGEMQDQQSVRLTMERTTQTEVRVPHWRQLLYCLAGDDQYRRQRQREAGNRGHINSVSHIDRAARVLFPASFALLNLFYWMIYAFSNEDFAWSDHPINTLSH